MDESAFHFDISAAGVGVYLGPTESRLMEIAWSHTSLTVKMALFILKHEPKPAYTTIMTIMNRLTEKGLLKRERNGRHFVYRAAVDRASFVRQRTELAINCLQKNFPDLLREMAG